VPNDGVENEEPNAGAEPNESVLDACCVGWAPNSDGCDVGPGALEPKADPNTLEVAGVAELWAPNRDPVGCCVDGNENKLEVVAVADVGCDPNVDPNDGPLGVEPKVYI